MFIKCVILYLRKEKGVIVMIHEISKRISLSLLNRNLIKDELIEVYVYGTELFLSFILTSAVILILGSILNLFVETLIFMVLFIGIRRIVGGFHANSYFRCFISTVASYSVIMILSKYCPFSPVFSLITTIVGSAIIAVWGPVENVHKKISEEKKLKFRKIGIIEYSLAGTVSSILSLFEIHLGDVITYTLMMIIVLMIIPLIGRRIRNV